jgi:hypothetical protein
MATPKEKVDLIIWDSSSLTVKQLASKYMIKEGTIRFMLRKNKITPFKPDPISKLVPKEELEALLANGWLGIHDMAATLNYSYHIVKKSLLFHGILKGRKPHTRNRIREGNRAFKVLGYIMANPEMPLEVVSKQFNCTREYVSQIDAMARQEKIIK